MADKHVKLDGRRFIVKFDNGGQPRAIHERKLYMPGTPMESFYDAIIWHHRHNRSKTAKTLPMRVLATLKGETND